MLQLSVDYTAVFWLLQSWAPRLVFFQHLHTLRGHSWASWSRLAKGMFHAIWHQLRYKKKVKEGSLGTVHSFCPSRELSFPRKNTACWWAAETNISLWFCFLYGLLLCLLSLLNWFYLIGFFFALSPIHLRRVTEWLWWASSPQSGPNYHTL